MIEVPPKRARPTQKSHVQSPRRSIPLVLVPEKTAFHVKRIVVLATLGDSATIEPLSAISCPNHVRPPSMFASLGIIRNALGFALLFSLLLSVTEVSVVKADQRMCGFSAWPLHRQAHRPFLEIFPALLEITRSLSSLVVWPSIASCM